MQGLRYTSGGGASSSEQSGYSSLMGSNSYLGGDSSPIWGGSGPSSAVSQISSGNTNIDGVLSGIKWSGATLTYSFPTLASQYGSYNGGGTDETSTFSVATESLKNATRYALNLLSQYTNMAVSEVSGSTAADIRTGFSTSANPTAYANYPSNGTKGGDIWYGTNYTVYQDPKFGQYSWTTVLHEVGHALGLKHGHETGGPGNTAVQAAFDQMAYTLMTYRSYQGANTGGGYTNESNGYAQTFMMYDIAALQTMYGANYNTNSTATTYTWSATTGQMSINGAAWTGPNGANLVAGANRIFMTLWDGGGVDTYDFSNYSTNLTVNLSPGSFSITSSTQLANLGNGNIAPGNIFNALLFNNDMRSLIENAIGGTGNDSLTGNQGDNALDGRAGDDTMTGAAGNDSFVYTAGMDIVTDFTAGGADDSIDLRSFTSLTSFAAVMALGAQVGSNVVFTFSAGNTLTLNNVTLGNLTSADFQLTGSVFNEISGTEGADTLAGTVGRDRILALGGNDTVDGRGGDDVIDGGEGDDTIYYYASDSASNVTGGNGTDTLLVIGGSAPTSFNLAAQGFEGARHEVSDTGGQAWSLIRTIYNVSWQADFIDEYYDNGTRTLRDLDQGNLNSWTEIRTLYNAAGLADYIDEYYDNGTRTLRDLDQGNANSWTELRSLYNAAAQVDFIDEYYDNGTRILRDLDQGNANSWTELRSLYTAAAQVDFIDEYYDNGTRTLRDLDQGNLNSWSELRSLYNAAAQVDFIDEYYDNGTRTLRDLDQGNLNSWSEVRVRYTAASLADYQNEYYDNGTRILRDYDQDNVHAWNVRTTTYDALGNVTSDTFL